MALVQDRELGLGQASSSSKRKIEQLELTVRQLRRKLRVGKKEDSIDDKKIPTLPKFGSKGNDNIEVWIELIEFHFEMRGTKDRNKVWKAAAGLEEAAKTWFSKQTHLREWEEFKQAIRVRFPAKDRDDLCRVELEALKCEGSVAEYNRKFKELAECRTVPLNEELKLTLYRAGLPERLVTVIDGWQAHVRGDCDDVIRALGTYVMTQHKEVKTSKKEDGQLGGGEKIGGREIPKCYYCGIRGHVANQCRKKRVEVNEGRVPFRVVTGVERDNFRREGKCFKCQQVGHLARDCPLRGNGQPQ